MSENPTYNGWSGYGTRASAYATWRIALEMFDGYDPAEYFDGKPSVAELAEYLKEEAFDVLENGCTDGYVLGWAQSFVDNVCWEEIAEHMLADWDDVA